MGASSNFGNMFSVLGASIFLPFLPMAPIQVLTNNLLYDFSQTTIPTDNVDDDYIAAPRRWDIGNITKFVLFLGPVSSIFDYVTYATLLFVFGAWNNPALNQCLGQQRLDEPSRLKISTSYARQKFRFCKAARATR
jgi:P-type Mg2+ transporter